MKKLISLLALVGILGTVNCSSKSDKPAEEQKKHIWGRISQVVHTKNLTFLEKTVTVFKLESGENFYYWGLPFKEDEIRVGDSVDLHFKKGYKNEFNEIKYISDVDDHVGFQIEYRHNQDGTLEKVVIYYYKPIKYKKFYDASEGKYIK